MLIKSFIIVIVILIIMIIMMTLLPQMVENESKSEGMLLFTGNATAHGDVYTWWKQGIPAKVCFTTQPKLFRWSTPLSLLS